MTLRDAINNDAQLVFLNTDEFAETVTYHPRLFAGGDSRPTRSIKAVVFRETMATVTEDGGTTLLPMFEVHVENDSTLGISSTELDTGGDQLEFAARDGVAATKRTITRVVTQDHGMLVLECR
jgi:hypothetical protein